MNLFVRNDPQVIKDAVDLSVEDFVIKYKPRTNEEVLSKAYLEVRQKYFLANPEQKPPVIPAGFPKATSKRVTFKVVQAEKETVNPGAVVKELYLDTEPIKKERKKRSGNVGEARDKRIRELLDEGMEPKSIIKKMTEEGFSVFAPQISAVKNKK
jgi:hypothetical protein